MKSPDNRPGIFYSYCGYRCFPDLLGIVSAEQFGKLEFDILTIIFVYSAKADNQFSITSLFNKTFKAFFELVGAFSRRINVSNTNAFVWLG